MKRSASNFKRAFKLWKKSAKARLMARMAYPGNFFILVNAIFVYMLINILFINVIFSFVEDFSGWSYHGALLIVASYMIIDGINWALFANFAGITRTIVTGDMDFMITKPIDTQLYVSLYRADPEDWSRVVTGAAVLVYAVSGLGLSGWALATSLLYYLLFLFFGIIIFYSVSLMVKSISFWTVQGWGLQPITESILYASRYPIDIYIHKAVRLLFYSLIPIAFMTSIPSGMLAKSPRPILLLGSFLVAAVFFYISRKFFHFALSRYSSASS
jgi:ABC-2 type transport system permease protein